MKCYKTVFEAKNLIKNYGFYTIIVIFILYSITLITFIFIGFSKLKEVLDSILFALKTNQIKPDTNQVININNQIIKMKVINTKKKKKKINIEKQEIINDINENKQIDFNNNKSEKKEEEYSGQITQNLKEDSEQKIEININDVQYEKVDNNTIDNKVLELKEFEINGLDYEDAIIIDQRKFFDYYFSLIKYYHPLTFSFVPLNDYNSPLIKKFLFFFSFSLDFTINTLFFTDDTMHKIYEDKGKYNFLYQLHQILYSTIISRIIDAIIKILSLSQDNIIELKQEKEKNNLDIKYKRLTKIIKIKFISFFIITFLLLGLFLYYITCFCGIYVNTQRHLIKDSIISFATGLLYPFVLYLIPSFFRITALKAEKLNRKCMYKFSSFIENYLC